MSEQNDDEELSAIRTLLTVLTPLNPDARTNVIDYVFRRLGIGAPAAMAPLRSPTTPAELPEPPGPASPVMPTPTDLRSLTDQKQPKSANQMVAILAYYLANLASANERREYIVADDIRKYFPQANFELPTGPHNMTLVNAKNAGYLDVLDKGQYRLNPVGHNLVTHRLPRSDTSAPARGSRRRNPSSRAAKKKKG